jgi:hypothetical protein
MSRYPNNVSTYDLPTYAQIEARNVLLYNPPKIHPPHPFKATTLTTHTLTNNINYNPDAPNPQLHRQYQ